jgi:hypothetical protein
MRYRLSIAEGRRLARDLAVLGDDATNRLAVLVSLDAKEKSSPMNSTQ